MINPEKTFFFLSGCMELMKCQTYLYLQTHSTDCSFLFCFCFHESQVHKSITNILHVGYCSEMRKDPDQTGFWHKVPQTETVDQKAVVATETSQGMLSYSYGQNYVPHCRRTMAKNNGKKKFEMNYLWTARYCGKHMTSLSTAGISECKGAQGILQVRKQMERKEQETRTFSLWN